jgi:hypothetical protein
MSNHYRHDLIRVIGDCRQRTQQRLLLLKPIDAPLSSCFMNPHVGCLITPTERKRRVILEVD